MSAITVHFDVPGTWGTYVLNGEFTETKNAVQSSGFFRYDPAGRCWTSTSISWEIIDFLEPFLSEKDKKNVNIQYRKLIVEDIRERVRNGAETMNSWLLATASVLFPHAETRDWSCLCDAISHETRQVNDLACEIVGHHACSFEQALQRAKAALGEIQSRSGK